jgi:NitT/TauT family transport system ATP-binding protein
MGGGLVLDGIDFAYGADATLQGIRLAVPAGQFVTLLGASGSGKSTLLRLAAGLRRPTRGRLLWNGAEIKGPSIERGVVFQDYALFPWMSLEDNIAIAVGKLRPAAGKKERLQKARTYLEQVGLEASAGKYAFELSGGMRQRGAIAMALALESALLLMDEPFGALDPVNRARLQDLLLRVWEGAAPRRTILFVTHDIDEALYLGDRVVILGSSPGRIIGDLPVESPRPRDRAALVESAGFRSTRERIAEVMAADTLHRLLAA